MAKERNPLEYSEYWVARDAVKSGQPKTDLWLYSQCPIWNRDSRKWMGVNKLPLKSSRFDYVKFNSHPVRVRIGLVAQ